MSLSKLPRELLFTISDDLSLASLNSLLRTCRILHCLLVPVLVGRISTEHLASFILHRGISLGHLATVHLALSHNAPWHTIVAREQCYSALGQACSNNRLEIVAALLTHFGSAIMTDNQTVDGRYCHDDQLEQAIRRDNLALTTILLEHGAPANRTVWYEYPSSDESPLDVAAKHASPPIAEVLIKHGAEVAKAGRALGYAADSGRWGIAKVLLRNNVLVWTAHFPWNEWCPLGERTPEQISAWVAAGRMYIKWRDERLRSMRAATMERRAR